MLSQFEPIDFQPTRIFLTFTEPSDTLRSIPMILSPFGRKFLREIRWDSKWEGVGASGSDGDGIAWEDPLREIIDRRGGKSRKMEKRAKRLLEEKAYPRQFVPPDADLGQLADIEPLFGALNSNAIKALPDMERWLLDQSGLAS